MDSLAISMVVAPTFWSEAGAQCFEGLDAAHPRSRPMLRNRFFDLIATPLLVPLIFAYLAAVLVAVVGLVRSLARRGRSHLKDHA